MSINSNIIVGVTGGIAAYKTPVLIRRLKEQGADVRAVMTEGANHFITPLTLQAVSGHPVRDTLLDAEAESGMDHIDLARWANKVIIAPASADFIAKLAHGLADDLLSTLCLATNAPIYIAPAMNQQMWQNPATQNNISKIKGYGITILGPDNGDQACGEVGPGRMLEPIAIIEALLNQPCTNLNTNSSNNIKQSQNIGVNPNPEINKALLSQTSINRPEDSGTNSNKPKILITAGPTWEALDPVRGLTNHSSGKMGYSIASAFASSGYPSILISGPTSLQQPSGVNFVSVISAQDMYNAVHQYIGNSDILISVAAVADFRPETNADQKIKKNQDEMELRLIRNPDILKSVTALETHPFTVGFAAETDNVINYAREKLAKKNLDMIIANEVGEGKAFGQDFNELTIISNKNNQKLGPDSKQALAKQLVTIITSAYEKKHSTKNP